MSTTISGDSTQYRRNRAPLFPGAQLRDGQPKRRRVVGVQRSHGRPIDEVNPLFVHPDTPDYGEQHVVE